MPESSAPTPKLPVLRIIRGAFSLPWAHRGEVLRATGIPLLVIIGCTLAGTHLLAAEPWVRWVVWGLYFVATAWLAIAVHRLVLLPTRAAHGLDPRVLRRLGIYVAVFFGIWILFAGVRLITLSGLLAMAGTQYVSAGGTRHELLVDLRWLDQASLLVSAWVTARFSLLLPSVAVDLKPDPARIWRVTRGNVWRVAVVVSLLPWLLELFEEFLYRDEATYWEYAILVTVTAITSICTFVALSLAYWELTARAPPPRDPPG